VAINCTWGGAVVLVAFGVKPRHNMLSGAR